MASPHSRGREAEHRLDRIRARAGWVLAPLIALGVGLSVQDSGLSPAAQRLAVINSLVVVLWVSEALPLWVPALLGPLAAWLLGVGDFAAAFGPFRHNLILLFLGGFVLAAGLSARGVDRRIALWVLSRDWIDGRPARARVAIAGVAFAFSMWISNTATTAMMVPIALGLSTRLENQENSPDTQAPSEPGDSPWQEGLLLTLAYAASLGGLCTPIGTAPNMIAVNHLRETLHVQVDFYSWMRFALPIGLVALAAVLVVAHLRYPARQKRVAGLGERTAADLAALGPVRPSQRRVVAVFATAVGLWILPAVVRIALGEEHAATQFVRTWFNEGTVALVCAFALVILPAGKGNEDRFAPRTLLSWRQALDIDWGTLILLGGGFSLGKLTFATGLAAALGDSILSLAPSSAGGLLIVATTLVIYLTELTSNTATTSMMLPVITPAALLAGYDPIPVALCVTMAASFAFMMPVSTPPNAIVYGTRKVRFSSMLLFGAWLDVIGLVLLIAVGLWWLPHLSW